MSISLCRGRIFQWSVWESTMKVYGPSFLAFPLPHIQIRMNIEQCTLTYDLRESLLSFHVYGGQTARGGGDARSNPFLP